MQQIYFIGMQRYSFYIISIFADTGYLSNST